MNDLTVWAVCSVTIEIPVRNSGAGETLAELQRVAKNEAEGILRDKLDKHFKIVGGVKFVRAVVQERT